MSRYVDTPVLDLGVSAVEEYRLTKVADWVLIRGPAALNGPVKIVPMSKNQGAGLALAAAPTRALGPDADGPGADVREVIIEGPVASLSFLATNVADVGTSIWYIEYWGSDVGPSGLKVLGQVLQPPKE